MTAGTTIDYEALAQEAMRGVVRAVLTQTAKSGLPGEHHFYVSFATDAPGAVLSRRLKEKYPNEMTIVLQHRFWDLSVSEDRFEVKLTFDGIPERLVVPFNAIKVFFDPSVRYGLQFEDPDPVSDSDSEAFEESHDLAEPVDTARTPALRQVGEEETERDEAVATRPVRTRATTKKPRRSRKKVADGSRKKTAKNAASEPETEDASAASQANGTDGEAGEAGDASYPAPNESNVVSLDAFRKK